MCRIALVGPVTSFEYHQVSGMESFIHRQGYELARGEYKADFVCFGYKNYKVGDTLVGLLSVMFREINPISSMLSEFTLMKRVG